MTAGAPAEAKQLGAEAVRLRKESEQAREDGENDEVVLVKTEAMRCGLAYAKEVFVVADGAVWSQFQDRLKRRGQFGSSRSLANLLVFDVAHKNNTLQFLCN